MSLATRRRDRQRLETRDRIYAAAIAEFQRVGFADGQVSRIAAAAGVAHGTFFFHFPTKDHVLLELQRRGEVRIIERLRTQLRKQVSVRAFLREVVEGVLAAEIAVSTDLTRELLGLLVRTPGNSSSASTPLAKGLTEFFADAVRRGEIRSDMRPEELTSIFSATLFGSLLSAVQSPLERRPALWRAIDVFIRGIAP